MMKIAKQALESLAPDKIYFECKVENFLLIL